MINEAVVAKLMIDLIPYPIFCCKGGVTITVKTLLLIGDF